MFYKKIKIILEYHEFPSTLQIIQKMDNMEEVNGSFISTISLKTNINAVTSSNEYL